MLNIFLVALAIYIVVCYIGNAYFLNVWIRYCFIKNSIDKYSERFKEEDCMVSLAFSPFCFPANVIWCVLYFGTDKCFFKLLKVVRSKESAIEEV